MNPYYIYVTLHLLECSSESFEQLCLRRQVGHRNRDLREVFGSDYDNGEESEYDCIEKFISNATIDL